MAGVLKKERISSRGGIRIRNPVNALWGGPVTLTCKCCGKGEFESKRTNTLFCGPNCRAKFYRQEAAESAAGVNLRKLRWQLFLRREAASNTALMIAGMQHKSSGRAHGRKLCEAKIEPALPERKQNQHKIRRKRRLPLNGRPSF